MKRYTIPLVAFVIFGIAMLFAGSILTHPAGAQTPDPGATQTATPDPGTAPAPADVKIVKATLKLAHEVDGVIDRNVITFIVPATTDFATDLKDVNLVIETNGPNCMFEANNSSWTNGGKVDLSSMAAMVVTSGTGNSTMTYNIVAVKAPAPHAAPATGTGTAPAPAAAAPTAATAAVEKAKASGAKDLTLANMRSQGVDTKIVPPGAGNKQLQLQIRYNRTTVTHLKSFVVKLDGRVTALEQKVEELEAAAATSTP